MGIFETMVQNMRNMEFFQYLFPFLLAFAFLYGLMQWAFKDGLGGKRVQTLIAIVFAFFVMLYSSMDATLYALLTNTSGMFLGIVSVILFIVLISELLGVNIRTALGGEKNKWIKYAIILIVIYIAIVAMFGETWLSTYMPGGLASNDLWTVILVIIIIAVVFSFVGGESKKNGGEGGGEEKPSK